MCTFIFGTVRVSFRMVVKFFKEDGKLFFQPCEKWIPKKGKQFTLFNCVKIERKDDKPSCPNRLTRFEVINENEEHLASRHPHPPNIWEFETPKRIKVRLQSNGTSAEFLAEYFRDENGIFHFHVKNHDKNAQMISKPKTEPKPALAIKSAPPTISIIDPKLANGIAKREVDNGFEKHGGKRFKRLHQRLATS